MMTSDVNIGLKRLAMFLLTIIEKILVVMRELDIGTRPATSTPKEEILGVMIQGMVVGMNI